MTKIAFLGLGLMGRGMALNLIKAGYDVTVWNRSSDKLKPLVDAGAEPAETPGACASGADVIITIVGGDEASESVWLGEDGILSGALKPSAIAIESTTVSRNWMVALGETCVNAGLRFLDCPVTGGPPGANSGQLTMLVGGEADTLQTAEPVLNAYAKRIYHFGPVGAGTAYKLIVNTIGAIQAVAVAEGMEVAKRAGLDLDTVADALGNGSVASPMTSYIAPRMAQDDHDDVRFAARWRGKDAGYGAYMAQNLGCAAPMFQHAAECFRATISQGMGDANESAVMRVVQASQKD
ncbi:NAD(P)-dependent oxidoreductase [Magnetovibrio sp. PR-2]|uniref:NAD(P)-dependent oxidoreductase n=1 Tax=Magnetovibrio sp. PR-2 TaxID=3120356 RepID=UPI002FCE3371